MEDRERSEGHCRLMRGRSRGQGEGSTELGFRELWLGKAPRKGHLSRVLKDKVGRGNEQSRPCSVKPGA